MCQYIALNTELRLQTERILSAYDAVILCGPCDFSELALSVAENCCQRRALRFSAFPPNVRMSASKYYEENYVKNHILRIIDLKSEMIPKDIKSLRFHIVMLESAVRIKQVLALCGYACGDTARALAAFCALTPAWCSDYIDATFASILRVEDIVYAHTEEERALCQAVERCGASNAVLRHLHIAHGDNAQALRHAILKESRGKQGDLFKAAVGKRESLPDALKASARDCVAFSQAEKLKPFASGVLTALCVRRDEQASLYAKYLQSALLCSEGARLFGYVENPKLICELFGKQRQRTEALYAELLFPTLVVVGNTDVRLDGVERVIFDGELTPEVKERARRRFPGAYDFYCLTTAERRHKAESARLLSLMRGDFKALLCDIEALRLSVGSDRALHAHYESGEVLPVPSAILPEKFVFGTAILSKEARREIENRLRELKNNRYYKDFDKELRRIVKLREIFRNCPRGYVKDSDIRPVDKSGISGGEVSCRSYGIFTRESFWRQG